MGILGQRIMTLQDVKLKEDNQRLVLERKESTLVLDGTVPCSKQWWIRGVGGVAAAVARKRNLSYSAISHTVHIAFKYRHSFLSLALY